MHHSTLNQGVPAVEQFDPADFIFQDEPDNRLARFKQN